MIIIGVIFLASYKLAHLYSFQKREIERNIAIKDALLITEKIFQNENEENELIQKLVNNLKLLRNESISKTHTFIDYLKNTNSNNNHINRSDLDNSESESDNTKMNSNKSIYSKEQLISIRDNNESNYAQINNDEISPILESYKRIQSQSFITTSSSSSSNNNQRHHNHEKKHSSNKKNQSKKKEQNNRRWGMNNTKNNESFPSLDNILVSALGNEHIIVKETP